MSADKDRLRLIFHGAIVLLVLCLPGGSLQSQSCSVPGVGSPDSLWRQVRASGFTFCVPVSWKPGGHGHDSVDTNQWKGDGTSVMWGVGRPRSGLARSTAPEVRSPIVGRGSGIVAPPAVSTQKCEPPTNTPVAVDGGLVLITQLRCDGVNWTTTGWSTQPAIYVQGEAHTTQLADLLVRIMQTIRFRSSP